jgi:heme-degrading monooxygenase HmoA
MVIVGTWDSRAAWSAWHDDEAFRDTRERLDATHAERSEIMWHEVLADVRAP